MNQPKLKTCEKKLKLAESKVEKILNRIEAMKLNNSFTSQLAVLKPSKTIFSLNKSKLHVVYAVIAVIVLVFGARWIYREWPSSQVRISFKNPRKCG